MTSVPRYVMYSIDLFQQITVIELVEIFGEIFMEPKIHKFVHKRPSMEPPLERSIQPISYTYLQDKF
jgi:hypothetical protein